MMCVCKRWCPYVIYLEQELPEHPEEKSGLLRNFRQILSEYQYSYTMVLFSKAWNVCGTILLHLYSYHTYASSHSTEATSPYYLGVSPPPAVDALSKLIYVAFVITLLTHILVSTLWLTYENYYALIAVGVTVVAHIIFIISIIALSYNAFLVIIVYQSCAMLVLIGLDVWTLAIMEISPNLSYLKDKCSKWDTKQSTNACVRKTAAILGLTSLIVTIINSSIVWPIFKDYLIFLKSKQCEALGGGGPLRALRYRLQRQKSAVSMDNRDRDLRYDSRRKTHPCQESAPYCIHAPYRDASSVLGDMRPVHQFHSTLGEPIYASSGGSGKRVLPTDPFSYLKSSKDVQLQPSNYLGGNTLYDRVPIPMERTKTGYRTHQPRDLDSTGNADGLQQIFTPFAALQKRRNEEFRRGNFLEGDLYPRVASETVNSQDRVNGYESRFAGDADRTSRYNDQSKDTNRTRYFGHSEETRKPSGNSRDSAYYSRSNRQSDWINTRDPPPDYY